MRYKDLGKTHKVNLFGVQCRIIYLVCFLASVLGSFLCFVWQILPLSYGTTLMLFIALSLVLGKLSEVPFCKELLWRRLRARVSFDP